MSVMPKTKGNGSTPSNWLQKISQHRVRSTTQQCSEDDGDPMGDHKWRTSTRHKMVE